MGTIIFIIVMVLLTAGTLFFSVNAMTLRAFSQVKLQDAFKEMGKDELAEEVSQNEEKLLLSCAVYRLLFNIILLLMIMRIFETINEAQGPLGYYLLTFVAGGIIFSVFSLAIPHAMAKYCGEIFLSKSYWALVVFTAIASPVLYMLGFYDRLVKRLAGVAETTPQQEQDQRQEEFLTDLEQQRIEGVVDEEEQEMIENVLELSETAADEIMTPRTDITAVEVNTNLQTVIETIDKGGHTRVPVYEENIDNIIGFVYAKDLLSEIGKSAEDFDLRGKLRQVYFVPETKLLRELLHEFQNQKLHIAVVLDEYGGTAGIVTLEDILEELVGEITDEYEETPAENMQRIDEDTIDIDARTYIDDANDEFELGLPEEGDYDTIGGFVFSYLGYIPKAGEQFEYENLKFTICDAERRRIKRIRIKIISEQKNAN